MISFRGVLEVTLGVYIGMYYTAKIEDWIRGAGHWLLENISGAAGGEPRVQTETVSSKYLCNAETQTDNERHQNPSPKEKVMIEEGAEDNPQQKTPPPKYLCNAETQTVNERHQNPSPKEGVMIEEGAEDNPQQKTPPPSPFKRNAAGRLER